MIILLVLLGIALYLAFGFLTAIVGLRNGVLCNTNKGSIFISIVFWPIIWVAITFIYIIDLMEPKLHKLTDDFVTMLVKIAKKKKDENV